MSQRVNSNFLAKTFHEFALEIIQDYQNNIPYIDKDFILIEDNVSQVFFLENVDEFNFNSIEIKNNQNLIAYDINSIISKLKDFGYTLKEFQSLKSDDLQLKMDIFNAYSKYELYKKNNNFLDFSDLLLYVLELLKSNERIRNEIKNKYKYILVDEFQDTNLVQLEILKLIASDNITVVGDQKQSIYSFRGANFKNLSEFKNHFKKYKEVFLHQNYRCSKTVLDNINKIISNMNLKDEILKGNLEESGSVSLIEAQTEKSQNTFMIKNISKILDKNPDAKIGVLFRRKSELKRVSSFLNSYGIKHLALGEDNFLHIEIVKEVLRILKIVSNPKQSEKEWFSLFKYYNLRDESIRKIFRIVKKKEKSIFVLLKTDINSLLSFEDERDVLVLISDLVNKLVGLHSSRMSISNIVHFILYNMNFYQNVLVVNDMESILGLNQILNFANNYFKIYKDVDIENFLKVCEFSKFIDFEVSDEIESNLELLTVHNSKGKEYDYVFMPYLNDRRFPTGFKKSKFDILDFDTKDSFLEEEKRLFFVGISRAKKNIFLSFVKRFDANKRDAKPSEFLDVLNLNKELFDKEYDEFKLDNKEKTELELIEKINKSLFGKNYDKAIDDVKLLRSLFDVKRSNSSLNSFIEDKHPDYQFYLDKILDKGNVGIEIKPESMVYSVSQLKTYESCPKKYLYSYIYRIPTQAKHYFDFGTSLHSVFEEIIDLIGRLPKEAVFANGIALLRKVWISKGYINAKQETEYFEKGVEAIRNFIDKELILRDEDRILVSQEEKFIINLDGKKIMGFIDRIDKLNGDFEILDYKTSNSKMTKSQLKQDLQLFIYGLACKELKGRYPVNVGLWYVIFDEILKVDFNEIEVDNLKEKALKLISGIEKKDFSPNPSPFNCKYCDYNSICNDKEF